MQIDYIAIGKRIRRLRREQKMSQEELAEKINVSTPHMSNIETGKTKFSLQVLIELSNALNTTPDMLLLEQLEHKSRTHGMVLGEIGDVLTDCTPLQMTMLEETLKSMKQLLQAYDKKLKKDDE